jgi:hypothetical protein
MYSTFLASPDVDVAEQALIRHFRPPMNDSNNPEAMPLPERYWKVST